jgi:D-alanyl-D-alanine carboxypeptidase
MLPYIVLSASVFALVGSASSALAQPDWFDQSQATARIQQIQAASGAPGLSAAIIRLDGQGIGTAVAGLRRIDQSASISAANRFHVGSNSKAFTAQIAARAVDSGAISWDTTIDEVFGVDSNIDPSYAGTTLRQLLTHQAGTPQFRDYVDWAPLGSLPGTPTQQRLAFSQDILSKPRAVATGADPSERYGNSSFGIAAAMVERATGHSWESMIDSAFNQGMGLNVEVGAPGQDGSSQPFGHVLFNDQLLIIGPDSPFQLPSAVSPSGNLSMSVSDLAEFGRQHLRAVAGLSSTLGLSASAVEALHDTSYAGGPFGMGWFDFNIPAINLHGFGHDGSTTAFDSILVVDTENGYAIAAASNGDLTGNGIGNSLIDAVLAMRASVVPTPAVIPTLVLGAALASRRRTN